MNLDTILFGSIPVGVALSVVASLLKVFFKMDGPTASKLLALCGVGYFFVDGFNGQWTLDSMLTGLVDANITVWSAHGFYQTISEHLEKPLRVAFHGKKVS